MRLLISGGGTAGHVYPALTIVATLQNPAPERAANEFLYLGRADSLEEKLARGARIPFQAIQAGPVRGKAPWVVARSLWRMYGSIGHVRALLRDFKPDAAFVTGGYVSAPVVWASAAEKIPSVIYLPDLEPGWAIRATARWATRVAVSFPEVEKHFARGKAITTGYPVRAEFYQTHKARAREKFHLDPNTRTIAIFGGSSGAHHINQAVLANLTELTRLAQVIHLTGRADETWVNQQVARRSDDLRARIRVYGYLDQDLAQALAAADMVIARAGAAALGEFPALGLPAMLVPGPYAGLHQERNADFLVARGAAIKVDDAALASEMIPRFKKLFETPEILSAMGQAMRALAQPNAAQNIVDLLQALAQR